MKPAQSICSIYQEQVHMPSPKPPSVNLTVRQIAILQRLTRQHSAAHQLVKRAQLILLCADDRNNEQIAQHVGLDRGRVRIWRRRWLDAVPRLRACEQADPAAAQLALLIRNQLADESRPGTTPTFTPEQVVQIVALTCEDPQLSARPISHWTPRELADEAAKRGIVTSISPSSVSRFFKSGRYQAPFVALLAAS